MLGKRNRDAEPDAEPRETKLKQEQSSAADEFLHLLDNDDEINASEEDVSGVMRSLEQEICSTSSGSVPEEGLGSEILGSGSETENQGKGWSSGVDLGYLLEASDDELGIGPAPKEEDLDIPVSVAQETAILSGDAAPSVENQTLKNIAENWSLEDEVWNYNEHVGVFGDTPWDLGPVGGQSLPFDGDLSASVA
eukprot:TRINITY_DN31006_c0_g1_i1.p1 TRINITY_DN31006_c0_g1~~TRINITY_DN31006_c0_g1_i1.p1  ORF type:complete len:194 (-),score=38.23 TRINITY_DN31006_c0_g1_i1:294-875(-)